MIAKVPPKRRDGRTSFKALTDYCLGVTGHGAGSVLHVGMQNLSSPDTAFVEMEALATENVRCKDPAFHFILSWREMEIPTSEQADEAVKIALNELDLGDCQALWALQGDTRNLHVHVAVNRIDPETGRAIQPAGNWTYKALERAARRIELAQGWEVEESGRCFVTPEGDIVEKKERKIPGMSQKARDIEAHTGTKSAERIARETAAPILLRAVSWAELHERLAVEGIRFERKGSGAVLRIGDAFVKTSQADRTCSFSRLVARLGEFREYGGEPVELRERPADRIAGEPEVERSWRAYVKQRRRCMEERSRRLRELRTSQRQERERLWRAQRAERESLWRDGSWRGRGRELNQRRSLLAARHLAEKLDLRDEHRRQTAELRERFGFKGRFPGFRRWLEALDDGEPFLHYRYPGRAVLTGERRDVPEGTRSADIRDYAAVRSAFAVAYCRRPGHADFIDCGRRIVLKNDRDEAAILAAMQLACQKWGSVRINGTDEEYRRLCVRAAARHGLKISNPDLGKAVEEERRMNREEGGGLRAKTEIFGRYAEAVGAERFRIVVTEFCEDGTRAFILDRDKGGLDGRTAEEVRDRLWLLERYARNRKNINVVPLSRDRHHILVDDLTSEKLEKLRSDGYRPACVVESSPGSFQALLTVPKSGDDPEMEREAANRLTKLLNERYGDPKLSGAVHAHRLPPFGNFKPQHRREDGSYPPTRLVEAEGGLCGKALLELEVVGNEIRHGRAAAAMRKVRDLLGGTECEACDPDGAYWRHYEDIAGRFGGAMDCSQVDGMIGIRMRVTGHTAGQVRSALERNGPEMRRRNMTAGEFAAKYRYRNWERYARETAENFVFGPRGTIQLGKAEPYRAYFLCVEGRTAPARERGRRNPEREQER